MLFPNFFTEEQVGYAVGYTAAFIVDNFTKVTAIKYGYKTVSWMASRTKIARPTGQVLFERAIDAVRDAY